MRDGGAAHCGAASSWLNIFLQTLGFIIWAKNEQLAAPESQKEMPYPFTSIAHVVLPNIFSRNAVQIVNGYHSARLGCY